MSDRIGLSDVIYIACIGVLMFISANQTERVHELELQCAPTDQRALNNGR